MFNQELFNLSNLAKTIASAWVFVTTVFFIGSFAFPMLEAQKLSDAYNNGRAVGQQETYNAAMQSFSWNTFQNGQGAGYNAAVNQLLSSLSKQASDGCKEPVPVSFGSGSTVWIISIPCLEMLQQASNSWSNLPNPQNNVPAPQQAPVQPKK